MTSWGLDLLSKLAESTSLDAVREDFPRKSDEGLNPAEFLAVVQKHIGQDEFNIFATNNSNSAGPGIESVDSANKVGEVFKQMDVRGDGDVCWNDFSTFVLQLELLHDSKGAAENEYWFKPFAAHLGLDGHIRGGGVAQVEYFPAPVEKLGIITKGNEVVHLVGQGTLTDDDGAPFRVECGGGSDLARISCSLRHDTAYKPHEVNAVHSIPAQDVVITSSSLGFNGPHMLTVWDLPTEEERSSEKQFLPALTSREETPTRQTVICWASALEMVLTGSSGNGALLGWELSPLRQSAKLWLHDAGITHVHELVGHAGGAPRLVTASADGTIAVCGGAAKGSRMAPGGGGVLQRLQAHERGVARMAFCLQHSLALSAGLFVKTIETTPDVLVWKLDRSQGLLEHDIHMRLKGHEGQVVGMVFVQEELEVVTGGADATFLVWDVPSLVLKQRFTRSYSSPLADLSVSSFSLVPKAEGRPLLLVAGMLEGGGLELFARVEKKVHEALIKAEFCAYLQRFVTVSGRRATVWDGKTGEALTTLMSERLLGDSKAEITGFSLDHQGHKLVVGGDTGDVRACFSHSGSLIRRLDPHDGPVNWLSFASRKTDKCVFSIGGDGALHVLDDADAKGYVKPSSDGQKLKPGSSEYQTRTAGGRRSVVRSRSRGETPISPQLRSSRCSREHNSILEDDGLNQSDQGTRGASREVTPDEVLESNKGGVKIEGEGHSVLLRQVLFSWGGPDGEEGGRAGSRNSSLYTDEGGSTEASISVASAQRRKKHPAEKQSRKRASPQGKKLSHREMMLTKDRVVSLNVNEGGRQSEPESDEEEDWLMSVPLGVTDTDGPESASSGEGEEEEQKASLSADGQQPKGLPTFKNSFSEAARSLMSSSGRDDVHEKKPTAATTTDKYAGMLLAHPTYDMTTCAADDHLNLIATAATSDGGIEKAAVVAIANPRGTSVNNQSATQGLPSSFIHLWDAEMMTLLGTLLFPSTALTRSLTSAGSAFKFLHSHSAAPTKQPLGDPSGGNGTIQVGQAHDRVEGSSTADESVNIAPSVAPEGAAGYSGVVPIVVQEEKAQASTAVSTETSLNGSTLLTALTFLSPYPLLAGASAGGAVALWHVPDCVCVQVILLPGNLASSRRKSRSGCSEEMVSMHEDKNILCMTKGNCTSTNGEDVTVIYVGNERGDILAAHLSPSELAELSSDARGPVPCQRRSNHNPYRAVRVKLTPQKASVSFQSACRAQRQAVAGAGTKNFGKGGKGRGNVLLSRIPEILATASGAFHFGVQSSNFHVAWTAHSAAIASLAWIDSPPSLLSASADGLAKIWTPDGCSKLGQLDINNRRPERGLSTEASQWAFMPKAANHHQNGIEPTAGTTYSLTEPALVGEDAGIVENSVEDSNREAGNNSLRSEVQGGDKVDDVETSMVMAGSKLKERRGFRRKSQQEHQQIKDDKHDEGAITLESMRFPIFKTERARAPSLGTDSSIQKVIEPAVKVGLDGVSPTGSSLRRKPKAKLPTASAAVAIFGKEGGKNWMSGWDGLARQLRDFEEILEASSSERRKKADGVSEMKPLSRATTNTARKMPLRGKRWRTKSDPWSLEEGDILDKTVSEHTIGPAAGSAHVGALRGMKGYVRPRPGTAENAALKRLRRKDATGMVAKDTTVGKPKTNLLQGRPLAEWLDLPNNQDSLTRAEENAVEDIRSARLSSAPRYIPPVSSNAANVTTTSTGEVQATGHSASGLPPVAVLAGSRGGRLIASGISIAGDQRGGGFNIKLARGLARQASLRAAAEIQLEKGSRARNGSRKTESFLGGSRLRNLRQGRGPKRGGGVSTWGWGRGKDNPSRANSTKTVRKGGSIKDNKAVGTGSGAHVGSVGSLGPSSPGVGSSGSAVSGGGSFGGTEGSGLGNTVGDVIRTAGATRRLNADSVMWVSSKRMSQPTSLSRRKKSDGCGQGETIRRLVHMGLL